MSAWINSFDPRILSVLGLSPELLGLFLVYVLATAGLMRILPSAFRKPVLLVASLLFGELFLDPVIALFVLGCALALFLIARQLPRGRPRLWAGAALLGLVFLPFCLSGIPVERAAGQDRQWIGNIVLLLVFGKRSLYFLYELHHGRVRRPGFVDFMVGMLSLPFLLGRAPIVAYSHLHERFDRVDLRALLRGSWTVLLAVLHLVALGVLVRYFIDVPMDVHLAQVAPSTPWGMLALVLGLNYLAFYLFRYAHDQISVGAARLLGFGIDDNYANPLAATDYADFWRRWNIHFRQMLVSMFYYPTVLRLSRRNPKRKALNVTLACVVVFFFHGLFMVFTMGIFTPLSDRTAWVELLVSLLVYELLQISLTAGSLLLLGRAHRTGRWKWIGVPLGISVTFVLRSLMLLLIWRRRMDLGGAVVVLLALMP